MTFSNKVKEQIIEVQNGFCKGCLKRIHSIHHKLPNTKENRRKYPKLIHSIFNAIGLCIDCHKNESHLYAITDKEAQVYEERLNDI